jgi:hypothetical protein
MEKSYFEKQREALVGDIGIVRFLKYVLKRVV